MEPNLKQQNPNTETTPLTGTSETSQPQPINNQPENILPQNQSGSCMVFSGILFLIILLVFIFFGNRIFEFFNILNFYYLILTLIISGTAYVVAFILIGIFVTYPKDILSLLYDRFR